MALTQVNFNEEEEKIIKRVSDNLKLNKPDTIRRMISSFNDEEELI